MKLRIALTSILLALLSCSRLPAQHDACRDAVRHLADGDTVKGLATLEKKKGKKNSPSGEAELTFVRALAAGLADKPAEALAYARAAVAEGLPFPRVQAGPRAALGAMYALPAYREWADGNQQALLHGPMVGDVTDQSAAFWVRTAGERAVRVEVRGAGDGTGTTVAAGRTAAADDYTAVLRVGGLAPDTAYTYGVCVDDAVCGERGTFRTSPRRGAAGRFTVGFGGGAGYTPQHEHMWTMILGRSPRAFLMLGDNVYIDDPLHALTQHYCYYRRQARPEWRRFTAATPVYSIYDDHDFGTNDCVPGPAIDTPPWKREVWRVFRQNWVNPAYGGGPKQPGCWYDFSIGDVHVIMLDCRYYRDLKGGSMIGPTQKQWLFERLKASRGTFKMIASSVPWSPGVKPGSRDTWDGFGDEREEIFAFIAREKVNGVLLLAADRHRSDLRRIRRPGGYDLYEMMSSRLTNVHTHGLIEKAAGSEFIFGHNSTCSAGLLDFDTTRPDPTVTYRIVTIDNAVVHSHTLTRSQLSAQ